MLLPFTLVIFLSAALLFLVQPMIAKLILPLLGGSPSVWNTCMVFFQAMLLGGYFYSHLLSKIRRMPVQAMVHFGVLLAAGIALPLGLPHGWNPPSGEGSPVFWLLAVLALSAGLPYFAVSTTGPLLQRWFSRTDHPHASDPYFLYAASNAGSILGLLAYPFALEPSIPLSKQGWMWTGGYIVFVIGVGVCAWLTKSRLRPAEAAAYAPKHAQAATTGPADRPITLRDRVLWIALAAVPSSLMLGVTNHVSTDVAAVPLLWIIPLALYLLTFIFAFSPRIKVTAYSLGKVLPIAAISLAVVFLVRARNPLILVATLHFCTFFLSTWMCHARLAASRPAASRLTEFYLWIAVGGMLGGAFNALIAPVVFESFLEYPIALVAAMLLRPREADDTAPEAQPAGEERRIGSRGSVWAAIRNAASKPRKSAAASTDENRGRWAVAKRWLLGPIVGPLIVALVLFGLPDILYKFPNFTLEIAKVINTLGFNEARGVLLLTILPACILSFLLSRHVLAFGLAFAVILSAYEVRSAAEHGTRLYTERTFFGVYDVFDQDGAIHTLRHGTTMHGAQAMDYTGHQRFIPRTYYYPTGPVGEIFNVFNESPKLDTCAFVGLGAGTLAAYGKPGRELTFFEIDPAIVRIAENPKYFTFLDDSDSKPVRIVVGDARLKLAEEPDGKYGLIVLDAFSSDAIPVHLLTKEAVEMYLSKLRPDGILAFHISNRYLELSYVLGAISGELHLVGYGKYDVATEEERLRGKSNSKWVILSRNWEALEGMNQNKDWETVKRRRQDPLWTDDFSNVLSIIEG